MKKTNGQRDKIATLRVGVIGLECSGQDMPGCIWMYFVHQVQSVIFCRLETILVKVLYCEAGRDSVSECSPYNRVLGFQS